MRSASVSPLSTPYESADLPSGESQTLCGLLLGLPSSSSTLHSLQSQGVRVTPLDLAALQRDLCEPTAPVPLVERMESKGRGMWNVDTLKVVVQSPNACSPGVTVSGTITLQAASDLVLESMAVTLECIQYQSQKSVTRCVGVPSVAVRESGALPLSLSLSHTHTPPPPPLLPPITPLCPQHLLWQHYHYAHADQQVWARVYCSAQGGAVGVAEP